MVVAAQLICDHEEALRVPDLSGCSEPERHFFETIVALTIDLAGHHHIHPQYEFTDTQGRHRYIDFAIVTQHSKIAIEFDGYAYHAEGAIPRDRFDDQLERQNDLINAGWRVLRFSRDLVRREPERCRDTLRRALISDPLLHPTLSGTSLQPHLIQVEALEKLEAARTAGKKRGLVVMATGLGKTLLSAFDSARVGGRTLFVAHSNEILAQARASFQRVRPKATSGFFNATEKAAAVDLLFASIATLRAKKQYEFFDPNAFDYVIVDEFHHAAAKSYERVFAHFEPKFMLGLTATPDRTDRQAILHFVDDNLIYELGQAEAIRRGFLVPFHYHALRDNVDYSQIRHNGFRYETSDLNKALIVKGRDDSIAAQYQRLAPDTKAVAFCVSIEHAERAAEHFRAVGLAAAAIHSQLSDNERKLRMRKFRGDGIRLACVRDLFNEGIDVPDLGAVLFMRPTESRLIFIQQLGRGLRLSPGKKAVKVLDFIGNYANAERIVSYLAEFDSQINLRELRKKPVLTLDPGCEISFQEEVLDTILHIDQAMVSGDKLAAEYFTLQSRLRRPPSLAELAVDGQFRLRQYVAAFGSWTAFLARLQKLDPEGDFANLIWPGDLGEASVERLASFFDPDGEVFREELGLASDAIDTIFSRLAAVTPGPAKGAVERRRRQLDLLNSALKEASEEIQKVVLVLDLSSAEPPLAQSSGEEPRLETRTASDRLVAEMKILSTSNEVHRFARALVSLDPLGVAYQRYVSWLGERAMPDLQRLRSIAFAFARQLETARVLGEAVLSKAD